MNDLEFKKEWERTFNKELNKTRKCLVDDCNEKTINSHVMQKKGILNKISENNHLYQFSNTSLFQRENGNNFNLKKTGLNKVFTFQGFCKKHDSSIFKPIESSEFNIKSEKSVNLFSYRTLCQEIRRKEVALAIMNKMGSASLNSFICPEFISSLELGLKNLYYFKKELEFDLHSTENNFIHKICEIPKVEICISSPLNIYDPNNPLSFDINPKSKKLKSPIVTSIINIFPFKEKSYLMATFHKKYPCYWTEKLFEDFQNAKGRDHLKLISDLISTRIEFWCISPMLKNKIPQYKIDKMIKKWSKEKFNHHFFIKSNFNLFE